LNTKQFYKNSIVLISSSVATGIVNFSFSILLSRRLGGEGLGLYGLIMPIYTLLICVICDGIIASMSKNISIYYNKGEYKNLLKTTKILLKLMLFWASVVSIVFFLSSYFVSFFLLKDPRALYSLKIICPALIFVGLSAVLKGFFYGIDQFKIPAFVDIVEKFIRISLLTLLLIYVPFFSIGITVALAYSVLVFGEVVSFILLFFYYRKISKKLSTPPYESKRKLELLTNVLVVSIPLGAHGIFSSIFSTLIAMILPRMLIISGLSYPLALSLIGQFNGMALGISTFPVILLNAVSTVLIPDISANLAKRNFITIHNRISKMFKITCWIGIANLIVTFTIPEVLGEVFFKKPEIHLFIKIASVLAVITFFIIPTTGILNGLGKQGLVVRDALIGLSIELILILILARITGLNIYGYIIAIAVASIIVCILNIVHIQRIIDIHVSFYKLTLFILLGILIYMIIRFINHLIPEMFFTSRVLLIFMLSFFSVFITCNFADKLN
jgi:stage V sporulation protein B